MSKGAVCDHCDAVLTLNERGEDPNGEIFAWLSVGTHDGKLSLDACTRACAIALLEDGSPLAEAIDERMAAVAEIVRDLRGDDPDEGQAEGGSDGRA